MNCYNRKENFNINREFEAKLTDDLFLKWIELFVKMYRCTKVKVFLYYMDGQLQNFCHHMSGKTVIIKEIVISGTKEFYVKDDFGYFFIYPDLFKEVI